MLKKFILASLCLGVTACGVVKKKTTYGSNRKVTVAASELPGPSDIDSLSDHARESKDIEDKLSLERSEEIISTALTFTGVKYKYGGTTRKGIDCSGLLYVSFLEHDVYLPRVSYYMANEGKKIKLEEVSKGDLLFFTTSKRRKRINHVGLVVAVDGEDIRFIHSTTSRGVIVSSLKEGFWNYAFVKATRVL
ncbi:C40 family peptidase [Muriicola soli]|uniref:NlpC/P60 family protein n=1 Tax=Muriicola soli TaxID=2507538 RepID=A0A411EBG8_9FLAO|nr:C40 family peptidase [Muriicola soli]QBA65009.1 NlpC/P60 family protein [Muriicola soli]